MRLLLTLSRSFMYITAPYSLILLLLSILFTLLYSDINNNVQILTQSARLGRENAVIFNTFYTSGNIANIKDSSIDLISKLDDDEKYISAVLHNIPYDLQEVSPNLNVTILIGNKLDDLYPELKLCQPAPCGMKGYDLKNTPVTPYSFEDLTIKFDDILPRDSVWFDTNSIGIDLNDHIIIRLSARHISKVPPESREEAITKSILFTKDNSILRNFIIQSKSSDLILTPVFLGTGIPTRLSELIATALIFLLALLSSITLATSSFIYSFVDLTRILTTDFTLRYTYGAHPFWIILAYTSHATITLFLIPIAINILIYRLIPPLQSGSQLATIYLLIMLAVSLILLYYSIRKEVYNNDYT